MDAIWFNQGQVCCAGSRLLVQEGVADTFHQKLRARMDGLRIGDPLDKCIDVGAIVDPVQHARITAMVAANTEGQTYTAKTPFPRRAASTRPRSSPAFPRRAADARGNLRPRPRLHHLPHPAEAVELANNTRYGLAATLWTENVNLALDIAPKLAAGVVWVNATNLFDAAAPFGGVRESGFGREGGPEGLMAYTTDRRTPKTLKPLKPYEGDGAPTDPLDRTAKLYIGGKQARPDGGYSRPVHGPRGALLGHASLANRKDIRNAVEAANAAKGWARQTAHNRAQVLYYIAENLSARAPNSPPASTPSRQGGRAEVDTSIRRLFTYAAWADKFDGAARSVPLRGIALAMREPVGTIAALCPDEAPLLGLISVMAPAIAMGNRVILAASEPFPLAATDFYQVLDTSDVPGGVVNILTGSHAELAPTLASHLDIDAVWSFSSTDLSGLIEAKSAGNLKRTWVNTPACATGPAQMARAAPSLSSRQRSRRSGCPTANRANGGGGHRRRGPQPENHPFTFAALWSTAESSASTVGRMRRLRNLIHRTRTPQNSANRKVRKMMLNHGISRTSGPSTGVIDTAFGKIDRNGNRHP